VTFPVDTALEVAVLEARAPQLTAHAACVPLAGPRDAPVAMLTAHVSDPGRLTDDDLGLLRDAAAIVAEALHAEHTEIESALRELSWRDRVTGVLNAARFDALLDETDRRCAAGAGDAYVVHVRLSNYQVLADRMGRALADLVRKDVARALALQADGIDVVARVGDATFGCILHGRRSGEVDYFSQAVADNVAASARRRGATAELRVSAERLGLGDAPGAPKLTARVENPPFAIGASAVGRSLGHDADR
jgi:diguanylate cyclase (GGDEF)-like protein